MHLMLIYIYIYFIPNPMLYLLIYTNIIIIVIAKLTSAEQWHCFLLELQMNSVCAIDLFLFEFIEAALKQSVLFCLYLTQQNLF